MKADAKRRILFDSISVTASSSGEQSFFTSSSGKTLLTMDPLINGELPAGQRATVDAIGVAFAPTVAGVFVDLTDDMGALDEAFLALEVQDGEGEMEKIVGHLRNFPAGGGLYGHVAMDGDSVTTIVHGNNGIPSPLSLFGLDVPIVIEPGVRFRVLIDIPTAIAGLTTSRWYVKLHCLYEEFLAG